MKRKYVAIGMALGLAISIIPGAPAAQEQSGKDYDDIAPKELAEELLPEADEAMRKRDFITACRLYERANELDPNPATEKEFIDCTVKMGLYGEAYGRMLDLAAKVPPDSAPVAKARAEEIKAEAPCIVIDVPNHLRDIRELEVALDGTPVPAGSWNGVCTPVNLGYHTVTAKAPQKAWIPQRLGTFKIKERYTITLTNPSVVQPTRQPDTRKDTSPGAVPAIVIGLLLFGTGVGTSVAVDNQEQTWPMGMLTGALLGTGAVLTGSGIVMYATSSPQSPSSSARGPDLTNMNVGLVGRF